MVSIVRGMEISMNFKYIAKKAAVVCLTGLLAIGGLTGCQRETKLVFTMGLSGDQIFKIGSSICTRPEIMIYLTTFYNQYADAYGEEMWNYDFGGVSLEEHVKDVVLSKMAQIKIMNIMARERDISLDTEEEKRVLAAAKVYYEKLNEPLIKQEKITQETAEKVYREYAIANKVYTTITESADMEISDDEARTVTVQAIFLKNWRLDNNEKVRMSENETLDILKTAKELLRRANEGEDFEALAAQYSDDKQVIKSYARGVVEPYFEELLFSMDEGDISDVIETEDGYYIVKCISTMDYEATQENKLVLAKQRQRKAFSDAYTEIATNTHSQFRDKYWEKLTLNQEVHTTEANFFDIYDEYVKQ